MIAKDLGFAVRTLRKQPAFTITAVLTIALGIGASTAIFSVVNALLLRPLPYVQPDRLATIQADLRTRRVFNFPWPGGDLLDVKQQLTAFESIAGISSGPTAFVGDDGKAEQIVAAGVTPNFFTLLGTKIAFGRNFVESDGTPNPRRTGPPDPNAPPPPRLPAMTILSHSFWMRKFGGDSAVIGKTIQVNGNGATIVGVASPDLKLVFPSGSGIQEQPELYQVFRIDWPTQSRLDVFLRLIGRLKPDANLGTAQAQADKLAAYLRDLVPIVKAANLGIRIEPMNKDIVREVRPAILALMGAVTFVLLIACANVANLLLVRAASRERELAVRSALGGSRGTLIRQMLAESLVLGTGGALLGLALAKLGIDLLVSIAPASFPRVDDVSIDGTVLGFTVALAVLSALIFGILPALRASRPNLSQTLRSGGRAPGLQAGKYLRHGVVIAEVTLSFVLLIGSGLMLRSFMVLENVDPGFDPKGVLTFTAFNNRARTPGESQAYGNTLERRLAAIPGVIGVTAASPMPLDGQDANMRWGPVAAQNDPSLFQQATTHIIRPNFFEAMHVRLIAGRIFTPAENDTSSHAIMIDKDLAAKAFPGQSPASVVGKQMFCRITSPEAQMYQVVGVVEHVRHLTLTNPGREAAFLPEGMFGFGAANRWAVRTKGDPSRVMSDVRRAVADVDPLVPVGELKPMSDYVDRAMAPTRFSLVLIGVFAAVAAVLAAVGLYGVLSTTVRQRTAEIGVRMAFGATGDSIFRLMIGQGLILSGIGIVAGLAAALALTGVMQKADMLVSIKPTDPITYASIAVLFVIIASLACFVPARRAAALDPNVALREE
ncbi:MAG TPA: ABC transporter permease [Gemmatimonadaceae bacterium]|nr:ABC transporter permease [Gemmatimonadaceae bacterium]